MVDKRTSSIRGLWRPAHPVRDAVILVAVHLVFAAVVAWNYIGVGYAFSDGAVSSYDELPRLGDGPRNGFAAIGLSVLLVAPLTLIALAVYRRFAWVVPVLGMIWCLVAVSYYTTTFEHPAPMVGG
jgi:hypothetical protein